jgi:HAD superfamily hydrolase (TIGR01509 family)
MSEPRLAVDGVSFDFGNTLVRVDRAGLRAVIARTADALLARATITDVPAFLAAWSEERDRQFRDEVPKLREVDMSQRVVRVLARLRGFGPPPADDAWDDLEAARFVDPAEAAFAIDTYSAAFVDTMVPQPDAGTVIANLAARGFRLGILSNWPYAATIDRFAEAQGWMPHLEAVIVSQRVGTIKPHPEIFRQAAAALAVPPERILHVGDDWAADVVGASRAGWRVAYVRNRQADTPLPTSAPRREVVPDLVVDELIEIDARIDRWTP